MTAEELDDAMWEIDLFREEYLADDGWAGATSIEARDEEYMPFTHTWDRTLDWCKVDTWLKTPEGRRSLEQVHPFGIEDSRIPMSTFARALPMVPR
jgi:hypothetical protein